MDAIVDTNVTLFQWPFRRVPGDTPGELVEKLRSKGVVEAWTGTMEGIFHRDLAAANSRLTATCREHGEGLLVPFGSINPTLPGWETDVRRCIDEHHMPGIRLHPNYHKYTLTAEFVPRLLRMAEEANLIVQLVATMEDERTQPHFAQVPHVDIKPLPALLKQFPQLRVVLLNIFRSVPMTKIGEYLSGGKVWVDIAMLESVGAVGRLIDLTSPNRILFGSHFPLFYFESSLFKMRESPLGQTQRELVLSGNARNLRAPHPNP